MEEIANEFREIRIEKKMSATEVALLAFGDKNQYNRITNFENLRRGITLETFIEMLKAMNCKLEITKSQAKL